MNRLLEAILRTDLRSFIPKVFATVSPGEPYRHNWHIETIAYQLERVFLGETTRLLINQPPRSLKSICVSVAYVRNARTSAALEGLRRELGGMMFSGGEKLDVPESPRR